MGMKQSEARFKMRQKRMWFRWGIGVIVSIALIIILVFIIVTFLILRSQGVTQGINTLTILSIVIGFVVSVFSLLISFLQWHHYKPLSAFEEIIPASTFQSLPIGTTEYSQPHVLLDDPQREHIEMKTTLPLQMAQTPAKVTLQVLPELLGVSGLQNQNRVHMLQRLRRSYNNLMSQSLQGVAWLELGLAEKPNAVQNATHLLLRMERKAEQHLPPGTSITEVYDETGSELLILGEPGAGKSTLLLDLAQRLVERAEQDLAHPLPVILPLSSWAIKRPKLQDWIAEQMSGIYDVPRKLSVQWVREGRILPLLDGLDEMKETDRFACIAAINIYHRDCLTSLVVCSRTTEYEAVASRHRLALQGAVVVLPLTHKSVDTYLNLAGKPLTALRNALKKNGTLYDLATTPLILNILILTYQGTSMRNLSNKESQLLQQVWNDYVQRMVERKGSSECYPLEQTRSWLGWLARQMRDHNQTVFYLEHLQPDWLLARQQRTYARCGIHLPAIVIGALMSILVCLFFFGDFRFSDVHARMQYGIMGGLLGGLWHGPVSDKGSQGGHRHVWRKRLIKRLTISACFGFIAGLSIGFHLSADSRYASSQWQTAALFYGLVMGLSTLLLQYLLTVPFTSSGNSTPRRFFQAFQGLRALLVTLVMGVSTGLTLTPFYEPSVGLRIGLSFGLIYGLMSLALCAQMENIHPTERLRWTWKSLRRGLFKSRHLHITLLLTCISMVFAGLSYGLSQGIGVGLSMGLSYWCVLGLFQGISQERIEDQDRRIANQGIRRSLRNSVVMGIIGGVVIGIIGMLGYGLKIELISGLNSMLSYELTPELRSVLSYGMEIELISGLSSVLSYGLQLGISGALIVYTLTGGLAVLRHYIVRLLLWHSCTFPWRVSQFLDDATARFLLRRVGGGYSFVHRLLLDHLADVKTEATPSPNASSTQFPHV